MIPINIFLLVINIILLFFTSVKYGTARTKIDEAEKETEKRKRQSELDKINLERVRKTYEDIINEIQPLKDEQTNCKRGDWCDTCIYQKTLRSCTDFHKISILSYCAKGICKEYAQIKGDE